MAGALTLLRFVADWMEESFAGDDYERCVGAIRDAVSVLERGEA